MHFAPVARKENSGAHQCGAVTSFALVRRTLVAVRPARKLGRLRLGWTALSGVGSRHIVLRPCNIVEISGDWQNVISPQRSERGLSGGFVSLRVQAHRMLFKPELCDVLFIELRDGCQAILGHASNSGLRGSEMDLPGSRTRQVSEQASKKNCSVGKLR